ncbi:MAG: RecQ family zinc-binding domain-containing protein, partial [Planctomycetales bacterium]|nr:RecQ family zinc-binding domain-containing protein [Planctomycetales bacterium]
PYHAGMKPDERAATQDAFMASNQLIVVATIAFGMGIDKSNIRAVYHFNLPKSLESYMQEIGRAGRDDRPALCQMFACADDVTTLENFSYGDTPTPETVRGLVDELLDAGPQFDVSIYDLAHRHDVRDLVVRTLLTYLELDDVLQSTRPFYTQFKFQPLRSSAEIVARFDPPRAAFLRGVFRVAKRGRTWFSLDADEAARQLGEPRNRIVSALDYLAQRGDLVVDASGVRHGYRRLRDPDDRSALVDTLAKRFTEREAHDVARVGSVVALAEGDGCLTRRLLGYFGEQRDDCGHCSRCAGQRRQPLPPSARPELTGSDEKRIRGVIAIGHEALATPRQLARFLCGLSSPQASRARLRDRAEYGMLSHAPFAEVLSVAERLM